VINSRTRTLVNRRPPTLCGSDEPGSSSRGDDSLSNAGVKSLKPSENMQRASTSSEPSGEPSTKKARRGTPAWQEVNATSGFDLTTADGQLAANPSLTLEAAKASAKRKLVLVYVARNFYVACVVCLTISCVFLCCIQVSTTVSTRKKLDPGTRKPSMICTQRLPS
jgi:hypothetical protein